jgi:predicted phage-related endonuclease
MDYNFLSNYSPVVTGNVATITFDNGYIAKVSPSLSKGLYRLDFRDGTDKPCTTFEQEEGGLSPIYGYLYQSEIADLLEEIDMLEPFVEKQTIFPISKSGTPLESLIKPSEAPIQRLMIEDAIADDVARYEPEVQALFSYSERKRFHLTDEIWAGICRQHGEYQNPNDPRYIKITVGGSDVANLYAGSELSKSLKLYDNQKPGAYKTKKEFWLSKVAPEKLKLEESGKEDIFFQGHALEPVVADYFERQYKKDHPEDTLRVFNDPHMYQCGRLDEKGNLELPFILCDLDRTIVINGVEGGLECKTCMWSSPDRPLWEQGIVPLHYYLQVQWYMLCKNLPFFYIACLTGMDLNSLVYIYIERNFAVEDLVIKMGKEFVSQVEKRIEPNFEDEEPLEHILSYYRKISGPYNPTNDIVKMDETIVPTVQSLQSINGNIDLLNQQIEELKAKRLEILTADIFPLVGDANKATVNIDDDSFYEITLKNKPRSINVDEEKLKANEPVIYEKYLKMPAIKYGKELQKRNPAEYAAYVSAHKPKFDASKFAKEHPELLAKYYLPDTELTDTKMNMIGIKYILKADLNSK